MLVNGMIFLCFINKKRAVAAAKRLKKLHFAVIGVHKTSYLFCPRCRRYLYGRYYIVNAIGGLR